MPRQFPGLSALTVWLALGCTSERAEDARTPDQPEAGTTFSSDEAAAPTGPRKLVDNALWQALPSASDPFRGLRDRDVPCPETEWGLEQTGAAPIDPAFELHTDVCNFLTVWQPSLAWIDAGEEVTGLVWHTQVGGEPGEGTMAIAIAETVIWEATTSIPALEGRSFKMSWTATRDVPKGAAVWFHVRNHGQNSWRFADFVVAPSAL